jgi:hypothetical protein
MEGHAMASIHKEMMVDASVEEVWAAIRDIGGIHTMRRYWDSPPASHAVASSGSPTCCPTIWRTSSMA